ncbi:30S ribosomal protein S12 methylthiotransferase RimO [Lentisphaerota bacterium WC36G]|nr:30S ribosomal protein S12 methylthiotransferase RimO [Lentisphaerae bacterium WC36]
MKNKENYIYIVSLGCAKNFVDTEVMAASLMMDNIFITPYEDEANIFLINSCAFIQSARDETTEMIQNAIKWKNSTKSKRHIIVSGCINQWDTDGSFRDNFTDVDLWVGIDEVKNIGDIILKLVRKKSSNKQIATSNPQFLYDESTPRLQLTSPHYAYLKISDGCVNNCTYCSIPLIRGKLRSRSIDSIVIEAQNLINNNVKELLLIGQDLTAFGHDKNDNDENLAKLLLELDKLDGDFKIRILYNHPAHLTKEVLDIMAASKHILHYFDIPLQHINNDILNNMNRKVTKERIIELLNYARKIMPDVAIRTTFIVGFPGETVKQYAELKEFVAEQKFTRMGVFAYCEEPKTKAISFENKVDKKIALERQDELMHMQAEISFINNEACIGKRLKVIIDSIDDESNEAICRSYMDAPEVDNIIIVDLADLTDKQYEKIQLGDYIEVEVYDCETYELFAKVVH